MSYLTKQIGTRTVNMEYRIIVVQGGEQAPTPAEGYAVDLVGSAYNLDIYIEYKVYDGQVTPI